MKHLTARRSRARVVEKLLGLGLVSERKELYKKRRRKSHGPGPVRGAEGGLGLCPAGAAPSWAPTHRWSPQGAAGAPAVPSRDSSAEDGDSEEEEEEDEEDEEAEEGPMEGHWLPEEGAGQDLAHRLHQEGGRGAPNPPIGLGSGAVSCLTLPCPQGWPGPCCGCRTACVGQPGTARRTVSRQGAPGTGVGAGAGLTVLSAQACPTRCRWCRSRRRTRMPWRTGASRLCCGSWGSVPPRASRCGPRPHPHPHPLAPGAALQRLPSLPRNPSGASRPPSPRSSYAVQLPPLPTTAPTSQGPHRGRWSHRGAPRTPIQVRAGGAGARLGFPSRGGGPEPLFLCPSAERPPAGLGSDSER